MHLSQAPDTFRGQTDAHAGSNGRDTTTRVGPQSGSARQPDSIGPYILAQFWFYLDFAFFPNYTNRYVTNCLANSQEKRSR